MKKVRTNALWNELSVEQRATLDKWLFEDQLGYDEALARAQKELAFKGSKASLQRYYARRDKERMLTGFKALRDEVAAVRNAPEDAASLRAASMKLLAAFLFEQVKHAPDKVKEWAAVADLLVRNDYNEIVRAPKAKEHQIRENAMEFAKEKFEYDTMEQALKALPQLQELAEAKEDPHTKRYLENAHWNRVRREMFLARTYHPESAEEEAEMIAAKREREARREREQQMQQEEIINAQPPTPSSRYYRMDIEEKAKKELEKWEMAAEYEI